MLVGEEARPMRHQLMAAAEEAAVLLFQDPEQQSYRRSLCPRLVVAEAAMVEEDFEQERYRQMDLCLVEVRWSVAEAEK